MDKCYKNRALSGVHERHVTGLLNPAILCGTLCLSPSLQADQSTEIAKYTLQREKTAEFTESALRSGKRPAIEISEHGGVFRIEVVAVIAAPAGYVRDVLTDYTHIYRLNPSIIESELVKQYDDGTVDVRTKVIGCAAYFCEELDRVEKVRQLPSGDLQAEIIPELSQFKSGQTLWRIKSIGDYCEVTYTADMEPDIYIPPVVGRFLIKKSIREEMHVSFANLEKISTVLAARGLQQRQQPDGNPVITEATSDAPCNNCVSNAFATDE